jgi:membrane protease YdiL (CAAX protease family)
VAREKLLDNSAQLRLKPLGHLGLYLALVWVLWTLKNIILELTFRGPILQTEPRVVFLEDFAGFVVVYLAALLLAGLERLPVGTYGLPMAHPAPRRFLQGCALGFVEVGSLMGLIALFGGYSFGDLAIHGSAILGWSLAWAVIFLFVGLFEEFAFRGYTLHKLAESIGFWPAAILFAASFGFVHSFNPGEGVAGEIGVAAIALIFAFTLRRTGTLWLAVGWHAAFDFGETFVFSVPDSGAVFPGHLANSTLHGPVWLTGGNAGPEASVFSFVTMAALTLAFHWLFPYRAPTAMPSRGTALGEAAPPELFRGEQGVATPISGDTADAATAKKRPSD